MSRRFPNGQVPRPANPAHRRDMCVDAIADLDMSALYQLVCRWRANADEATAAAAQAERTTEEISAALVAWMASDEAADLTKRDADRLINTLTQPSLISLLELS